MSKSMTLYRGITVPTDHAGRIVGVIRKQGIRGDEGHWRFKIQNLRGRGELLEKPDLTTVDTRADDLVSDDAICACGDELGASYYACVHNKGVTSSETPYLIKLVVPEEHVSVDGRDFLYTAFQLWDRDSTGFFRVQSRALVRLFGRAISKYFAMAACSRDQQYRIAMCDLACSDVGVIRSHRRNRLTIQGRYSVVFQSAFFVKVPIGPSQVRDVRVAAPRDFTPSITLEQFISGKITLPIAH